MRICDFPGSRPIGKPRDWVEELDGECGTIYVSDAVDTLTGLPVMYTVFKLSDDEIDALKQGGLLRLGIVGQRAHPVFNMGVLSPALAEQAQVTERGDLGGVIDA